VLGVGWGKDGSEVSKRSARWQTDAFSSKGGSYRIFHALWVLDRRAERHKVKRLSEWTPLNFFV